MRRILLNLSLTALAVAMPLAAHAGSFDTITFTSTSGLQTYAYTVPNAPTTFTTDGANYIGLTVGVSVNGGAKTSDLVWFLLGGTSIGGGLFDRATGGDSFSNSAGLSLFNDSLTGPIFNVGATGTGFSDALSENTFSMAITGSTPASPAPAPEPSSLMLLGTGTLGLCGAMRRKLFA
jgi:hypothetical protein